MLTEKKLISKRIPSLIAMLMFSILSSWAGITINISNKTLENVLKDIEKVSDYHFFYKTQLKGLDQIVSISTEDEDIKVVMNKLLKNSQIDFTLENNNVIILFAKETILKKEKKQVFIQLSGIITDYKNKEPIIGGTVRIKGLQHGTVTNYKGEFTLTDVPTGSTIEISYIGYESVSIIVNEQKFIHVELRENLMQLDEVVIVGYGSQKKVNLTGAVSVIKAADINGRPSINTATVLQGADPALNIAMSSGGPSSGYNIDIRGVASINGGTPLILVDGVEMSLSRVNANDIESVSILKDASASATYGAKASSGVVLITTKSGSLGGKPIITLDAKYGWKSNTTSTDFVTSGYWSAYINDYFYFNHNNYAYTTYSEADYAELWMRLDQKEETAERPWAIVQNDGSYKYYANFDWYHHYFKDIRPMQDYNVSVRGGDENVNYYVSGRLYKEDGIMAQQTDTWENYNTRAKLNIKLKPWLRYGLNASFFNSKYWYPGTSSISEIFRVTGLHALAFIPSTNPDGTSVYMNTYTNGSATVSDGYNAVLNYGKHFNEEKNRETVIKNSLDIDLSKHFTITVDYAYDWRYKDFESRRTRVPYSQYSGIVSYMDNALGRDQYYQNFYRYVTKNYNAFGTYTNSFDENHNLKIMAGHNGETYQQRFLRVERYNLLSEDLSSFNMAIGEVSTLNEGIYKYITQGWFGRVNYDYIGKYLLEFSGRYDGTSRFKKDSRWGFFPSASLGWRISEENFWKPLSSWWNNLKFRASLGSLGNQQVDYYSYIQSISTDNKLSGVTLDGTSLLYYAQESIPVAGDLTWETVTTYNLGVDLAFFKNRLNITADAYIRDTKNMLTPGVSLPAVYGTTEPNVNSGDMRTKGWELSVQWNDNTVLFDKKLKYSASIGIGDYTTKITRYISNPNKLLTLPYYEGMVLGEIWGFSSGGLFKTDEEASNYDVDQSYLNSDLNLRPPFQGIHSGDVKYLDLDGDKVITIGSNTADDPGDRYVIGNSLPRYSYNMRLGVDWNGIDFSVFFQGVGKRDWYPSREATTFWGPYSRPYQSYLPADFLKNVWSEDNQSGYFPRARGYEALGQRNSLGSANDYYIQNIAYLRLKNLSVGYTLPIFKKTLEQVRIYFSGENLWYWSPLKKYCKTIDPESANALNTGITYNFAKTITIGATIEF